MTSVAQLAKLIDYPDTVPANATAFSFYVDEAEIRAEESAGRLKLTRTLWKAVEADDDAAARVPPELADLAAGRILREEAVLAWDPTAEEMILWQDIPAAVAPDRLRLFFEVFLTSCDWWSDRVKDLTVVEPVFPDMMIRP